MAITFQAFKGLSFVDSGVTYSLTPGNERTRPDTLDPYSPTIDVAWSGEIELSGGGYTLDLTSLPGGSNWTNKTVIWLAVAAAEDNTADIKVTSYNGANHYPLYWPGWMNFDLPAFNGSSWRTTKTPGVRFAANGETYHRPLTKGPIVWANGKDTSYWKKLKIKPPVKVTSNRKLIVFASDDANAKFNLMLFGCN